MKETEKRKIRVLVSKAGLDGHTIGAMVISRALRDAGMEVIYTGLRQTPEMIVNAAIQEAVDVIGVSILSGVHMTFVPRIIKELKKKQADNIKVIVGGVIPARDIERLKKKGVSEVFPSGSSVSEIIAFIQRRIKFNE